MVPDPLTADEGTEGTGKRRSFIGRVKFSRVDCDCEICESGRDAAEEAGYDFETDYDHFLAIEPLTEHEGQQNVLGLNIPEQGSYGSKWMVQMGFLSSMFGNLRREHGVEDRYDLEDFLEGKVFRFEDVTWTEDDMEHPFEGASMTMKDIGDSFTNTPDNMWVPVGQVSEEEVAEETEGEVDTGEVDEVSLE